MKLIKQINIGHFLNKQNNNNNNKTHTKKKEKRTWDEITRSRPHLFSF